MRHYREIAFTPRVEAAQEARGSRALYARSSGRPAPDALTDDEIAFVGARNSFYIASVNADGWPYIQHRGGPRGFVRAIGPARLAFADYSGNRQFLSVANVEGDDRVALFFMDYPNRTRLKMFAHARIIEAADAPEALLDAVRAEGGPAIERVVVLDIEATNWNCPQYIVPRWDAEELSEREPRRT